MKKNIVLDKLIYCIRLPYIILNMFNNECDDVKYLILKVNMACLYVVSDRVQAYV